MVPRHIHIPEVTRQCVDIPRVQQLDVVVVGLVAIFVLHGPLVLNLPSNFFIFDLARVGATVLDPFTPRIDPSSIYDVVGHATVVFRDLHPIVTLEFFVHRELFSHSLFG